MEDVPSVSQTFAKIFQDSGWAVRFRDELATKGFSFDFVSESQAAIVFCKEIAVESLEEAASSLTAEVAAITQRRSIGVMVWEGYLLLLCTGDLQSHEKASQSVQHDLAYCRKIVVPVAVIADAADRYSAALRFVAFLLPLKFTSSVSLLDVRRSLVDRLEENGIDSNIATELVVRFDELPCRCGVRLKAFVEGAEESTH